MSRKQYGKFWISFILMGPHNKLKKKKAKRVRKKSCSENILQIYRRTTMPKCDFNKIALQLYRNYISA